MKRLTEYTIPETGFFVVSEEKYKRILMEEKPSVEKVYNQLKKIEDILGDEYDLDRLCELAQADREGKIPKYTIGDTIYDRFGDAWEVTAVERRLLAGEPKWIYRCGHIGTNDYCALWEFEVLTRADAEAALRREQDG